MKGEVAVVPLMTAEEVVEALQKGCPVEFMCALGREPDWYDGRPWVMYTSTLTEDKEAERRFIMRMMRHYGTRYRTYRREDKRDERIRELEDRSVIQTWAIIVLLAMVIFEPVIINAAGSCGF